MAFREREAADVPGSPPLLHRKNTVRCTRPRSGVLARKLDFDVLKSSKAREGCKVSYLLLVARYSLLPKMLYEYEKDNSLRYRYDAEQLWIQPWGENAFRIRATKAREMPSEDWALQTPAKSDSQITISEHEAIITNGKIKATLSQRGKLMVFNQEGEILLEEYHRNRRDVTDPKCSAIEVEAREFKPILGGDYHLTARFESVSPKEKIYGMGQYQQDSLDLKGHDLELAQRNSQASVPFALSSLGYGLLWNNPAVGRAVLGKNIMSFEAYSTRVLDYWVVAGDTPAE